MSPLDAFSGEHFAAFGHVQAWVSLLTLTVMEIVLGIDNIIFISLTVNQLAPNRQARGRTIGLLLALLFRVALLTSISWLMSLRAALFTIGVPGVATPFGVSGRDLILMGGGLFLIYKTVSEIYAILQGEEAEHDRVGSTGKGYASLPAVIVQIIIIDIVFSFDSILTAVGLVDNVLVMIAAVICAMIIMIAFSGTVAGFVNRHPTVKMLALVFLVMIGFMLVLEAAHQEVEKGYLYFAMAFALLVELLNMRVRNKASAKQAAVDETVS